MRLTKNTRGATIALITSISSRSEWCAVPVDDGDYNIAFVHKRAAALFGSRIQTADLFTPDGNASRLALEIYLIASRHGWVSTSIGTTKCPILSGAWEHIKIPDHDQDSEGNMTPLPLI